MVKQLASLQLARIHASERVHVATIASTYDMYILQGVFLTLDQFHHRTL